MFRQTLIKLTLLYLGIMMLISLFFSVILYQSSIQGLDHDFGRQADLLQRRLPGLDSIGQYLNDRRDQLNDEKLRLFGQLVITNVIILGMGGLASYVLARRTLEPIEAAHEAQARFTADASHELRTPLAVMQTEIEVTLMDPNLSLKDAKSQLRSNLDELARLTSLSEGLLHLAQSEREGMPKKPVALATALQAAIDSNKKAADKKHITISLKKIADDLIVMGDKNSLVQCFDIILNNAVKYCPEKSDVVISARRDSRHVSIVVRDNGPGISEAALPHLFERFYRADSSRTSNGGVQGYGLGLAIAENIVKMHRGDITAKSIPGKGTTFQVNLPA